jgi:ketosteroid isomerase-like protein
VLSEAVLRRFIERINGHDVAGMANLMTEDHRFTDAVGAVTSGKRSLEDAWSGYFRWFPDYKVEPKETYGRGGTFVVLGFASGTLAGRTHAQGHWRLPAAWRAVVQRGLVKEWSVYCDTKVPYDIISKDESGPQARP